MEIFELARSGYLGGRALSVYETFRRTLSLPGDVAECGVFTGITSRELTRYLESSHSKKVVHLFDSFSGLPDITTEEESRLSSAIEISPGYFACSLGGVRAVMSGLAQFVLHPGLFSQTLPSFSGRLCFIHADADLYRSTVEIIQFADRCLVPNGAVVFDDYLDPQFPGVELAVRRFLDASRYDVVALPATNQCVATKRTAPSASAGGGGSW